MRDAWQVTVHSMLMLNLIMKAYRYKNITKLGQYTVSEKIVAWPSKTTGKAHNAVRGMRRTQKMSDWQSVE
jgi:hypothetical protein